MSTNIMQLLKSSRFLALFITQFLGAFNDNVFKNALVILITYQISHGVATNTPMLVTVAAGIFILPFFLFSITAGQVADKFEKSRLIQIIKFFEILLMILASIGFYFKNISLLMWTLFLIGIQASFFGPVKYAILPDLLKEDELIAGNGLIEAGTFLSILLGAILGGILILLPKGSDLISAITIAIAGAGLISSKYIPKTTIANPQLKINFNFIQETWRIISYSKQRSDIFLSILGISWFWLVGAVFLAEIPIFTHNELHADKLVVTFFIALFSMGIGLGSLFCNRLLKGRVDATYVPIGALGISIFTIDLFFATHHANSAIDHLYTLSQFLGQLSGWRISLDLLFIAICGGIYTVPLYAILQHRSEKSYRARIIASNNVINAFFMVVAALANIFMLKLGMRVSQVFLTVGIFNAAVAVYICKLLPTALIRTFFRWLLHNLYHVKVVGLENYYNAGDRVVIVANHTSFLDALLLSIYLPDQLTFAVDTFTAQKWWIKFFLRFVNFYPMDPTKPAALKSLIDFVKKNKRCVIFPEGRITMTGSLMKIYEGPGLIADKAKAKLLPIRIDGAQFTPFSRLRGKVHIRFMPKITLTIMPAQQIDIPHHYKGRLRRQKIGDMLYDVMTTMVLESSNYQQTLFSSLLDAKATHGRKHAIIDDIDHAGTNYQQFIMKSFVLGRVLAEKTMPGEYVGMLLPNMVSTALTFFALHAFCRVPAMLNFSAGIYNVIASCQAARIKTVYTSLKFIETAKLADMVAALTKENIEIIYLENLPKKIGFQTKLLGWMMALVPRVSYKFINMGDAKKNLREPDAPAVVLFTSGSEGTPKGVVLSHKNLQANRYQLSACVDFTASDRVFNALPVFHAFGLTSGLLLPLLSGVKVFLYPSPLHYRIVPVTSYSINATILFGTDTFLAGYAKYADPYDFYSIRYVFAGAEKLREETRVTWMKKFGVRIFEGYGTTETSPVLSTNTPMRCKTGTVGRLLPGIQYQLEKIPGISEGGVLHVAGTNVMKGYLLINNPGVLVPAQGWYNTGDIIVMDDQGYITILGRAKRFAKIAGEMISLTRVEQFINSLWPDYQHAVVNVTDEKKGEQLILATTYEEASRDEIIKYAKANGVAEISIPRRIEILKQLPLLGSGKIDYVSISARLN